MDAKMRRCMAAGVATAVLLVMAAPAAWAEEPTSSNEPPSIADAVAEAASAGNAAPEQLSAELSLPAEGPGSLIFDSAQRIAATVQFEGAADENVLTALGALAEVKSVNARFGTASILADPSQFAEIDNLPGVASVSPAVEPLLGNATLQGPRLTAETVSGEACGPIPIEADGPLRSAEARATFGADGTGVTVGIISNTFNRLTIPTSWADDVVSGALPGAGNPCGRTQEVELVGPIETTWSETDEGRGMAQLVHGIAPGAKLLFADMGDDMYEMATSVQALAEAGADIIVDDTSFANEPYFQQGPLSVTINEMRELYGISYFTSAGNSNELRRIDGEILPINGWRTDAFRGMPCPDWVAAPGTEDPLEGQTIECMDFGPTGEPMPFNEFTYADHLTEAASLPVWASVGEAMFGPQSQIEIRAYSAISNELVGASAARTPGDPLINAGLYADPADGGVRLVFVRVLSEGTTEVGPALWFKFAGNSSFIASTTADRTVNRVGMTVAGHAGDGSSTSVGAIPWNGPTMPEQFSSLGPTLQLFGPALSTTEPAAPLPAPVQPAAPALASVDGIQTTFFGQEDDEHPGVYRFYGTSAAAPNAAAVAALGASYNPAIRGSALEDYVIATADPNLVNPIAGVSFADLYGAGRVDAMALMNALPAPEPKPDPQPDPKPEPQPEPKPAPPADLVPDAAQTNSTAKNGLASTGSQSPMPWLLAGGALVVLGAAGVSWSIVHRRKQKLTSHMPD